MTPVDQALERACNQACYAIDTIDTVIYDSQHHDSLNRDSGLMKNDEIFCYFDSTVVLKIKTKIMNVLRHNIGIIE